MSEEIGPVLKVADILSRRGQTIYGRQTIVDLCGKTGVSLTSGYDTDLGQADSEQALMSFIIEYSKLCPAAKLTVLILSELYEVEVPKEMLGKKKILSIVTDVLESLTEFTHGLSDLLRG
jgi:hypothetical protein